MSNRHKRVWDSEILKKSSAISITKENLKTVDVCFYNEVKAYD